MRARVMNRLLGSAILLTATVAPMVSWAAPGNGASLNISPSVASAGLGGCATAVFWSADLDDWANPALLGYVQGLEYGWSTTHLVPVFSNDVRFRTYRLAIGGGGIGVDLANANLDYGQILLTGGPGSAVGTFRPSETSDPCAVGVSLSQIVDAAATLGGRSTPAIARYADVAFGYAAKDLTIDLAPSPYGGRGSAHVRDHGLLVRVNPVPRGDDARPFFEVAYGHAVHNYDDAVVAYPGEDIVNRVEKQSRDGLSLRVGLPIHLGASHGVAGWIVRGMSPYVTMSVAADYEHHPAPNPYNVDRIGLEVDLGGLLTGRLGHVSDEIGDIHAYSYGAGIGLPVTRFAGLRYDFASEPESTGLSSIHRHGIGAWFDLVALARR